MASNSAKESDKLKLVQGKVDDVKGQMVVVINQALERGEKIEKINADAEQLKTSAEHFGKKTNQIKNAMWWKNLKMKLGIGAVILIVLLIIILVSFCYSGNCK